MIFIGCVALTVYYTHPFIKSGVEKHAHISIDDVVKCYQRLVRDSATYKSIFDDPFFSYLKNLHDGYGCSVTLYSFLRNDSDFTIQQVPTKFKKDFETNRDWLKIGFHGVKPLSHRPTNRSFAEFTRAYKLFNSAVGMFAGEGSIAKTLRLDFYYTTKQEANFLKQNGVSTLLSADDDRISYSLPFKMNRHIIRNNSIRYDSIKYLRTSIRIENIDVPYINIVKNRMIDTLVVFTHEWKLNRINRYKLERTVEILKDCDYTFISE